MKSQLKVAMLGGLVLAACWFLFPASADAG
jgi:hypothetical protein